MFDPYRKWLGILPKDQPPNHYRLLGVELFEHDLDVIEGAAERQMAFVRQYQSGEHAAAAAKILNELAMARLCLLKPSAKSEYDAMLREQQAPFPEFENELKRDEIPDSPTDDQQWEKLRTRKRKKPKSSEIFGIPTSMLLAGVGIAAVLGLLLSLLRPNVPQVKPLAHLTSGAVEQNPSSEPTPGNAGNLTTDTPKAPASATVTAKPKSASNPAGPESNPLPDDNNKAVDLLKRIDLKRDAVLGNWRLEKTELIGELHSRIYLPVTTPDDYQLRYSVRRLEGEDTLIIGFTMAGRQGMLSVDGWDATKTGLHLDGREGNSNSTTQIGRFIKNGTAKLVLTVHPGHLHFSVDEQTVVDWHGNPDRLTLHYQFINRGCPFLMISKARYAIEAATLVPIEPEHAPARPSQLDREIDVLANLDVERETQRGHWKLEEGALYSPEGMASIYLPSVVPEEYTIAATVEAAPNSSGDALTIGLVAQDAYFQFVASASCGLDMIDGRRWHENESRLDLPLLKPGVPIHVACTVTKNGIRIDANGKTGIDWRGDVRRLSIPGDWALADARRLYLGTNRRVKIRDVKIGPPTPPPKLPRHPEYAVGQKVDLLAMVDPARDAYVGSWDRSGPVLRCRGDARVSKLAIPVDLPEAYKLSIRLTRTDTGRNKQDALDIGCPIAGAVAHITLDGVGSSLSGVAMDFHDFGGNSTSRKGGPVIPVGKKCLLEIIAQKTGLKVIADKSTIIDWNGNPERFSLAPDPQIPVPRLTLGSWEQGFLFEKLELEPLTPTEFPEPPPPDSDGKLLPLLNADRDARRGDWQIKEDGLYVPAKSPGARFQIPTVPTENYLLEAAVQRRSGDDDFLIGLVVGGSPCVVILDSESGKLAGLKRIDGKIIHATENVTSRKYRTPLLPKGEIVKVRCCVMNGTILVSCGDKEVIRWHADARRLSLDPANLPPNYSEDDRQRLWLGSSSSEFRVADLTLKELSANQTSAIASQFQGVFPTELQRDKPFGKAIELQ